MKTKTLVIRVSADAQILATGNLLKAIGVFEDRYIILNGKWTEPINVDLANKINHLLAQAKRTMRQQSA